MTVLELNAKKAELVKSIINGINNEEAIDELLLFVEQLTLKSPCQYTEEEIKVSALEAIRQMKEGEYTSHEEMKRFTEKYTA